MRRSGGQEATAAVGTPGFTIVELMFVIAILGLTLAVRGLALASLKAPRESAWIRELRRARAEAIRTGAAVRPSLPPPPSTALHRPRPPRFLPDGRALGPGVHPLTGAPRDSAR